MATTYSISTLAREFDTTARTLRFYEAEGILKPARRRTTRLFSERDRQMLAIALRARRLGLSVEDIRLMASLYDGDPRGEEARVALQKLALIRQHRQTLRSRITDANEALSEMDDLEAKILASLRTHPAEEADDGQLPLELG